MAYYPILWSHQTLSVATKFLAKGGSEKNAFGGSSPPQRSKFNNVSMPLYADGKGGWFVLGIANDNCGLVVGHPEILHYFLL